MWMVDDGSTDGSATICKEYEKEDSRFHYVYQKNSGWASSPRNTGLELATGEWVGFPDPDDYCEPTMYEVLVKNSTNSDIVLANMIAYDVRKNSYPRYYHVPGHYDRRSERILSRGRYDIGFINRGIFRRSLIGDLRFMHTFCEDCIWETALLNKSKLGLTIIPDKLYHYFIYADSLVRTGMNKDFLLQSYKNIYEFVYRSGHFEDNESLKFRLINHLCNYLRRRSTMIDLVVPIVDPSQQSFINDFKKHAQLEGHYDPDEDSGRFNNDDTLLKYVFRSIDKWMNFIGVLHVIVRSDDDIPKWLDTSKVNIIYHSDYIPEKFLPTFNSCTIECFLSGLLLSENFIYINDDMIALSKLSETDFFVDNNPVITLETTNKNFFDRDVSCRAFLKMFRLAGFREGVYYKCRHIFAPFKMTQLKIISNEHKINILRSITRFRSDINISQWFFTYYTAGHFRIARNIFRYSYIGKYDDNQTVIRKLSPPLYKATCINYFTDNKETILGILQNQFNEKCSYER